MNTKKILGSLALIVAAATSARADIPWHAGDAPPSIAGVKLNESKADLLKQLGAPSKEEKIEPDGAGLTFAQPQITVTYTPTLGVASVYLLTPQSGDLDGFHIGSSRQDVADKWGAPTRVQGKLSVYVVGWWAIVMRNDKDGNLTELYVGRLT